MLCAVRRERLIAGALLLCALAACARGGDDDDDEAAQRAVPQRLSADGSVHLTKADRKTLSLTVSVATQATLPDVTTRYGTVRAKPGDEALVVSPVAARVVGAPHAATGDAVAAGADLVDVEPLLGAGERIQITVQAADLDGQIAAAARELQTAKAEAKRTAGLAASQIVSVAKRQAADTKVATIAARLAALKRARRMLPGRGGGRLPLLAPMDGVVAWLPATQGAPVSAGEAVARVVRDGPRWISVRVPPDEATGTGYEVRAGKRWVPATLAGRGAVATRGQRTDRLVVAMPDAKALVPGNVVAVRVAHAPEKGVVLPSAAVLPVTGGSLVFVETKPGVYEPRPVVVAARFGGRVRLASGVKPGEKVVTRGAMALLGERLRSLLVPQD